MKCYTMKEACSRSGLSYETLKFYCNQGLVPGVKRNKSGHRVFDERTLRWIESLTCLKRCGMSIQEMKTYVDFCLQGEASIPERKIMLEGIQKRLLNQQKEIQASIDYIDWKQNFYDEVLSGKTPYVSNLLPLEEAEDLQDAETKKE